MAAYTDYMKWGWVKSVKLSYDLKKLGILSPKMKVEMLFYIKKSFDSNLYIDR